MGVKQFDTRIQMKRDSATNWTSANPVLLNGEIIVVDTNSGDIRYKVGDGIKTYTQLPFSDESLIASMLSLNGGTMNGNINMSNHKITGLGAPVNPSDAVRQQDLEVLSNEIDDIIEGTTAITLPIADETKLGGVKIGEGINVDGEGVISAESQLPTGGTPGQLLTKTEDGEAWQDGEFLPLSGGTISGNIGIDIPSNTNFLIGQNGFVSSNGQSDLGIKLRRQLDGTYITLGNSNGGPTIMLSPNSDGGAGFIDIESQKTEIKGVVDPTNPDDAANKYYVDTQLSTKLTTPTGTQGQYLGFTADNVVGAVDGPESLPSGATEGQILYQGANGAEWGDKPVMYVNITAESGGTYSADKTAQEIYEAYQSGCAVFAVPFDTDIPIMLLNYAIKGNTTNEYVAAFSSVAMETTYSFLINDISNYFAFAEAKLDASDITFTPASPLTSDNVQDAIEEVYTKTAPTHQTITLSSSAWSSNTQTVTVNGVTADELDQLITPTPAIASQSAYYEAGIMCTNQGANSLTFTCQTVPSSNLTVYVVIQEVR